MYEITIAANADSGYGHVTVAFSGSFTNYAHVPETHGVGLAFSCQFSENDDGKVSDPYAFRLGVTEGSYWHPFELETVQRICVFSKRLLRSADRMREQFGRPATFGQWVAYHLAGVKLSKVTVKPQGCAPFEVENRALADTIDDLVGRTQRKLERKVA